MKPPDMIQTERGLIWGMEVDLSQVSEWRPTVTQVRDAVLEGRIAGSESLGAQLPPEALVYMPTQRELETLDETLLDAVRAGRLIDLGHLPNDVLKQSGRRGGALFNQGALPMPFRQPWMFLHGWEGGICVYLVKPLADGCEVAEFNPAKIETFKTLMLGDRMSLEGDPERADQYRARPVPSPWRFVREMAEINQGQSAEQSAAGNLTDPLMTALLILHTRGIDRQTICPPAKLQRARMKAKKPPLPAHEVVDTAPYVTALHTGAVRLKSEPHGGTHASPRPHLRRGHIRNLASGERTFVRDTLVNMDEAAKAAFKAGRSHYAVKP